MPLQKKTLSASERTTHFNIIEFSNASTSVITGRITSTIDMAASHTSYLNNKATDVYADTETSNFYATTKTTKIIKNIETETNFYSNTDATEILTVTSEFLSNTMYSYQSIYVTAVASGISGSFFSITTSQRTIEMFASPGYVISSYGDIILPFPLESHTANYFPQSYSETSILYSVDTQSDNLFNTLIVYSSSLSSSDTLKHSVLSMTISPSHVIDPYKATVSIFFPDLSLATETPDSALSLLAQIGQSPITTSTVDSIDVITVFNSDKTVSLLLSLSVNNNHPQITRKGSRWMSTPSVVDTMSYSSSIEYPPCSYCENMPVTTVILNNRNSEWPSSIIDNMRHNTTGILNMSYSEESSIIIEDSTSGFLQNSQERAASVSTSLDIFFQSMEFNLTLRTIEYHAEMQTKLISKSFVELQTNNANKVMYSTDKETSGTSETHTNVLSSEKQIGSINDIQSSRNDLQSTYFETYHQSTDADYSVKMSEYQSKSSYLQSQSGILSMDLPRLKNPSSYRISTVFTDAQTEWISANTNFNSKTMPSFIQPSYQQTYSGNLIFEIDTSFKDSSTYDGSFSRSFSSEDPVTTILSSGVFKSISTLSTSTIQSGLSDKAQNILFISTTAALLTIIVVILCIILARMYVSKDTIKPSTEDTNIRINSCSIGKAFTKYSFIGENIHPMLNNSFYEYNWDDIV